MKKALPFLLLAGLSLIWGSSFILMRLALHPVPGLDGLTALELAALRLTLAGIVLLPWSVPALRTVPRKDLLLLLVSALVGNGIPAVLFSTAQTQIPSAMAGMLNALSPVFTMLIGRIFFSIKLSWAKVIGIAIGLFGAVLLIQLMNRGKSQDAAPILFAMMVVLATICYGTNVNLVNRYLTHVPALQFAALGFGMMMIPSALWLGFSGFADRIQDPVLWAPLGYVAILAVLGSALSTVFFNKLLKITTPTFAASVTYTMQPVAIVWGLVFGEAFSLWMLLGIGLILAGIALIRKG